MSSRSKSARPTRIRGILATLLIIIAINAFGGAWYGLAGAKDVPIDWLAGSPFKTYFIPSLILLLGVGGSAIFSAIALLKRYRIAVKASLICGIILLVWIAAQVSIIGFVSWLQPTMAMIAIVVMIFAKILSKDE
jgi:hypothetical protein